jgi:uncharacterized protein YkwD
MKKVVSRIGFFTLILSLFASAQPVLADGGVIGTPPALPDPTVPSLQYSGCDGKIVPAYNSEYEDRVIELVNQERTKRGLTSLVRSEGLTNAARYQAADMSQDDYFGHDTMDRVGGKLVKVCNTWERIAHYYTGANGENAAAGYHSPESVMNGWMNSSGHRANILNPNTRAIGVGFYKGSGYYHNYWIQDFGTKIDTPITPTLGLLPENLSFMYSIPDQKLFPSYQYLTPANVSSSEQLSWQVAKSGSFFSVSPGNGTTPTQIRITPDNFNHNQANTYLGAVTINVTDPSSVAGSPHQVQIKLMVLNKSIKQVFLPGIQK